MACGTNYDVGCDCIDMGSSWAAQTTISYSRAAGSTANIDKLYWYN